MHRVIDLVTMDQLKQNTFLKEKDSLLSFIRKRVSSFEEAEDILQDVFYQFISGFNTIESIDKITAWLYRVARNKIIDRYRYNAVRPKRSDFDKVLVNDEGGPLTLQEILPDLDNTPESIMLREAIWEEIMEALDELPLEQRVIFLQNEVEEKSFREISEESGTSINTLLSRKRYAVQTLRKRLQKFYDEVFNL